MAKAIRKLLLISTVVYPILTGLSFLFPREPEVKTISFTSNRTEVTAEGIVETTRGSMVSLFGFRKPIISRPAEIETPPGRKEMSDQLVLKNQWYGEARTKFNWDALLIGYVHTFLIVSFIALLIRKPRRAEASKPARAAE